MAASLTCISSDSLVISAYYLINLALACYLCVTCNLSSFVIIFLIFSRSISYCAFNVEIGKGVNIPKHLACFYDLQNDDVRYIKSIWNTINLIALSLELAVYMTAFLNGRSSHLCANKYQESWNKWQEIRITFHVSQRNCSCLVSFLIVFIIILLSAWCNHWQSFLLRSSRAWLIHPTCIYPVVLDHCFLLSLLFV